MHRRWQTKDLLTSESNKIVDLYWAIASLWNGTKTSLSQRFDNLSKENDIALLKLAGGPVKLQVRVEGPGILESSQWLAGCPPIYGKMLRWDLKSENWKVDHTDFTTNIAKVSITEYSTNTKYPPSPRRTYCRYAFHHLDATSLGLKPGLQGGERLVCMVYSSLKNLWSRIHSHKDTVMVSFHSTSTHSHKYS